MGLETVETVHLAVHRRLAGLAVWPAQVEMRGVCYKHGHRVQPRLRSATSFMADGHTGLDQLRATFPVPLSEAATGSVDSAGDWQRLGHGILPVGVRGTSTQALRSRSRRAAWILGQSSDSRT